MKELTREHKRILEIVCAPATIDEPEESDFIASDEASEESFVKDLITKELN